MALLKTVLAVLFRTFGLPPHFLSVKPSFLYHHLSTQHSDFSIFLGISSTEKPVDRNKCFCSHVAECFFHWKGLSFRIFTQNKLGVRTFRATKCQKYMVEKFTRSAHLWPSSETQGQIVGARESLNGPKNKAQRKVKNGQKSPWGQCLTRPVPNGRHRSSF